MRGMDQDWCSDAHLQLYLPLTKQGVEAEKRAESALLPDGDTWQYVSGSIDVHAA